MLIILTFIKGRQHSQIYAFPHICMIIQMYRFTMNVLDLFYLDYLHNVLFYSYIYYAQSLLKPL